MLVNDAQLAAALPGFEIGRQIGKGAFGVVLQAKDRLGRDVAVKVIPRAEGETSAAAETEARILHQLRHPHIVEVFDFVPAGDIALIVMELLNPESLRERLKGGLVAPEWGCAAALALASALEFAHGHDLVHRDVKPLNVLFTATGRLKLTDFGIAKAFGDAATVSGTVLGTPTCMAPEQFLGLRAGRTVDVYALGIVTYELLAGQPPSHGVPGTYEALRQFHLETAPPPMPRVHEHLRAVVTRALAKEPERRQQTATDFAVELAHAATATFGPEWLQRAGLEVVLEPDVLAAVTARRHAPVQLTPATQRFVDWPARPVPRADAATPRVAEPPSTLAPPPVVAPPPVAAPPSAEDFAPPVPAEPAPRPRKGSPFGDDTGPGFGEPEGVLDPWSDGPPAFVFETLPRGGLSAMATRAGPESSPPAEPARGPTPSLKSTARAPSIVLRPRDDEEYRRAGRRSAVVVIGVTLSVIAVAVLLAVALR